jgi:hypothetical protein
MDKKKIFLVLAVAVVAFLLFKQQQQLAPTPRPTYYPRETDPTKQKIDWSKLFSVLGDIIRQIPYNGGNNQAGGEPRAEPENPYDDPFYSDDSGEYV